MAALGGAASQITKDIEEQEKDVKLRTRTILDRHVAETAANRKEYKANKKKVQEQLNSIVSYFGNDPDRWNKARAIVAGGDAHVAKMSQYFAEAQDSDKDVNEIYKLTKSENDVGLKGIEDTTNSLVQMAQIAQPSFGVSGQMSSLLGSTDMSKVYQRGRQEFEKAGLLDAVPTATEPGGTYGTGVLDLSKINTDAKSIDQQKANILRDLTKYKPGTPEYKEAQRKEKILIESQKRNSLALIIAKEQNKTKGQATVGFYQTTLKNGLAGIENRFKGDVVTDDNNNIITDLEKREEFKKQKVTQYKTDFVNNLIRNPGGISSNGLKVIQSDPELNDIYNNIMDEEQEKISGGEKGDKKQPETEKSFFEQQEEILNKKKKEEALEKKRSEFKQKFGDDITKAATDLFGRKNVTKLDVFNTLKNIYQDKSEQEIYDIVSKAQQNIQIEKDKPRPRPDDGSFFDSDAEDAWDEQYKGILDPKSGLPLKKKKKGSR